MGRKDTDECVHLVQSFDGVCKDMGIPINEDKNEGPTDKLTYLGLILDSSNGLIEIPK